MPTAAAATIAATVTCGRGGTSASRRAGLRSTSALLPSLETADRLGWAMEYVHQQLHGIVRDLCRQRAVPAQEACLAELYILLGRAHMQQATQLVDRGVACLASGGRPLFRVGAGHDASYCVLPGGFCSACARRPDTGVGGAPCVHTTAVLVAAAQSRCAVEELPPLELATALFSIT